MTVQMYSYINMYEKNEEIYRNREKCGKSTISSFFSFLNIFIIKYPSFRPLKVIPCI